MATTAARMTAATVGKPGATGRVLAGLCARREHLIDALARASVPGHDPRRLGDLYEAAERGIDLVLEAMTERRSLTHKDIEWGRPYWRHAIARGATQAEMLRACRESQRVVWDVLSEVAGSSAAARAEVAELSRPLMDYVEVFSETAAEIFSEVEEAMSTTIREGRRELLDDLLAGRVPSVGPKVDAVRACGLDGEPQFVVISAVPVAALEDDTAPLVAATVLARSPGAAQEPLVATREQEIVIVRPVYDNPERLVAALDEGRRRLKHDQIPLAIGVSAMHVGVAQVPSAYEEAWLARERVSADGGVIALATMSAFDYLLMRGGDWTAWRLVPVQVRRFIEDDLAQAGLLVDTLTAYVDCNLNAKLTAAKLFVHHNTAHHRLAKIAELTGCDLRCHSDVMQLVIAIELARRNQTPAGV